MVNLLQLVSGHTGIRKNVTNRTETFLDFTLPSLQESLCDIFIVPYFFKSCEAILSIFSSGKYFRDYDVKTLFFRLREFKSQMVKLLMKMNSTTNNQVKIVYRWLENDSSCSKVFLGLSS